MLPKTIKEIARTVEIVADIGLPYHDRDAITTFPNLKKLISPASGIPPEIAAITGISSNFGSQIAPKTTNGKGVPVCSVAIKKNANIVAKPTIPAVIAKHVSIVAKLAMSGMNAVPDAKFWAKSTYVSTRHLRRQLKKPPTDGMFKFDGK